MRLDEFKDLPLEEAKKHSGALKLVDSINEMSNRVNEIGLLSSATVFDAGNQMMAAARKLITGKPDTDEIAKARQRFIEAAKEDLGVPE